MLPFVKAPPDRVKGRVDKMEINVKDLHELIRSVFDVIFVQ